MSNQYKMSTLTGRLFGGSWARYIWYLLLFFFYQFLENEVQLDMWFVLNIFELTDL